MNAAQIGQKPQLQPMIKKIVTTLGLSSLEAPFLNALVQSEDWVRDQLRISKRLEWQFISTATLEKPATGVDPVRLQEMLRADGIVEFNVGNAQYAGAWDQHGAKENASLCEMCSLDIVRSAHDFTNRRGWLVPVFAAVRKNDIDGSTLCKDPRNLRMLMSGLAILHPESPERIMEVMTLAFLGVFQRSQANFSASEAFRLDRVIEGVAVHCREKGEPEKAEEFADLVAEAEKAIDDHWNEGVRAVEIAEKKRQTARVKHPRVHRQLSAIMVETDSVKAAPATRKGQKVTRNGKSFFRQPYDVAVICRPNGHTQVTTGTIFEFGPKKSGDAKKPVKAKWRLDLGPAAQSLRIAEARKRGLKLEAGKGTPRWDSSGVVFFEDGTVCPWYFPEFRTAALNGSLSSPDMPPTSLSPEEVFAIVVRNLHRLPLLRLDPGGNWRRVEFNKEGDWRWAERKSWGESD